MTFYMIGIGLNDEKDISVKGLEFVKKADKVFLESYTSKLSVPVKRLEEFYDQDIVSADRNMVEKGSDDILGDANEKNIVFLVVGDVFSATTHTDLFLRAKEKNIDVEIVHNASVLTAVGVTGLELYKFGKTTSMPYPEKSFNPTTAYDVIKQNQEYGLHTLVLLDIKPDRNMTVNEVIEILWKIEAEKKGEVFTKNTMVLGCARLGGDFKIKYGKAREVIKKNFGNPLHCLIVPGKLHFVEEEALEQWKK